MNRLCSRGVLAALLLSLIVSGSARAAAPDAWITTKAKTRLLTTEGVSATRINVDTIDGRVTLHGNVASNDEKTKAEEVVKGIDGVTEVRNLLQVVPAERQSTVKRSDDELKRAVRQSLARDRALADSEISVQSVNGGVVLLAGRAASATDHLRAIEDASRTPGVKRVASEIQSSDALADDQIRRSGSAPSKAEKDRGLSDSARDARITAATKLRLLADSATPALDINVDTADGVVTLFGTAPDAAAKKAVEADARKVSGVKRVVNEIEVVPNAAREVVRANDDDVKGRVEQSIASRRELKDVSVAVKGGVVRLTGTVPTEADRLKAAVTARSTAGVRAVHDELRIRAGESGRTSG